MTQPPDTLTVHLFLSSVELGMEMWEYDNAVRLLAMLEDPESGVKIDMVNTHVSICSVTHQLPIETYDCGSAACIGGHIHLMQGHVTPAENAAYVGSRYDHPVLGPLFFPGQDESIIYNTDGGGSYDAEADALTDAAYHATPAQAARALRSALTTGRPNWRAALLD